MRSSPLAGRLAEMIVLCRQKKRQLPIVIYREPQDSQSSERLKRELIPLIDANYPALRKGRRLRRFIFTNKWSQVLAEPWLHRSLSNWYGRNHDFKELILSVHDCSSRPL